ncbi:putative formin-like protein 3 isoform X1 [Iris pallida]|uniref:Formin-like protein 3 isoform X1 n=1 Tax=Iris pallida TaxID=29817 RepID=A0AAX6HQZ7_IRIPA|nr:putative formin-like protein 3 isoform X1 [Iris pallida]
MHRTPPNLLLPKQRRREQNKNKRKKNDQGVSPWFRRQKGNWERRWSVEIRADRLVHSGVGSKGTRGATSTRRMLSPVWRADGGGTVDPAGRRRGEGFGVNGGGARTRRQAVEPSGRRIWSAARRSS